MFNNIVKKILGFSIPNSFYYLFEYYEQIATYLFFSFPLGSTMEPTDSLFLG